jgi:two-component system response regulator ResD
VSAYKILVVDDEAQMRKLIKLFLSANGLDVIEAKDGMECLELVKKYKYDLIILDIMMPFLDGFKVCETLRKREDLVGMVPILMLSAKEQIEDRVKGLMTGADDYLVKPFSPEELLARVRALLRRTEYSSDSNLKQRDTDTIIFGKIKLDQKSRIVKVNDQTLNLKPKEYELLYYLVSHPDQVFSREHLLDKVWTNYYDGDIRTVDTHVKRLRSKLSIAGITEEMIATVWGIGYRFTLENSSYEKK